jgi:hypothetical protein
MEGTKSVHKNIERLVDFDHGLEDVFQVSGLFEHSLANMQPSQQMCLMPRAAASLSQ